MLTFSVILPSPQHLIKPPPYISEGQASHQHYLSMHFDKALSMELAYGPAPLEGQEAHQHVRSRTAAPSQPASALCDSQHHWQDCSYSLYGV